jgi:ubiquinone/menaquinone biosynthesis C-methylase UbiE
MLQRFFRQFGNPTGALGHVAGWFMARKNGALNAWVVELLDAQPDDRVIEAGFGTGLGIALNAARVTRGRVAGVDRSPVMLAQASRRNRAAIREGRVALQQGDAVKLPFADASATRAMAVNSLQFWSPREAALRELHRVLAPGGRLVLAQRLRKEDAGRLDRSRFGMTEAALAELVRQLGEAGFRDVRSERRAFAHETLAALVCTR